MAWRRSGDKPLSEAMMVSLPTYICVTRPQWVNTEELKGCSDKRNQSNKINIFKKVINIITSLQESVQCLILHITKTLGSKSNWCRPEGLCYLGRDMYMYITTLCLKKLWQLLVQHQQQTVIILFDIISTKSCSFSIFNEQTYAKLAIDILHRILVHFRVLYIQ